MRTTDELEEAGSMIQLSAVLPKLLPDQNRSAETEPAAPEIRTDQDRVLQLLETHSGITWQSHVVSETEWSKSKVSRVLSKMEANGTVRRYRIKRQKVVCLPGAEPDCLKDRTTGDGPATKSE